MQIDKLSPINIKCTFVNYIKKYRVKSPLTEVRYTRYNNGEEAHVISMRIQTGVNIEMKVFADGRIITRSDTVVNKVKGSIPEWEVTTFNEIIKDFNVNEVILLTHMLYILTNNIFLVE